MLAHFGGKLTIRHFVGRFQFNDDATDFLGLDVLAELSLGFTGTKDQQRVCASDVSKHFVINFLAVAYELSLLPIFCNEIIRRVLMFRV